MFLLLLACTAASRPDKDGPIDLTDDTAAPSDTSEPVDTADSGDPADTADTGDTGDTGAPPLISDWIVLTDLDTEDADGDGIWMPGEVLTVWVTLTNVRDEDYWAYPGATVASTSSAVDLTEPAYNAFFGIFAGESSELPLSFSARPDATLGERVELTVEVVALGCPESPEACLDPQTQLLSRAIGE